MQIINALPPQGQLAVGIFLMALGVSFVYKSYVAMIKGKVKYWQGFLPITLVSPFFIHLPTGKRSLIKETEGLWVHMILGPLFMLTAVLCGCAGADLAGMPGTKSLNMVLRGGKAGADLVTFDTEYGYRFPVVNRIKPAVAQLFGQKAELKAHEQLVPTGNGSLDDALHH